MDIVCLYYRRIVWNINVSDTPEGQISVERDTKQAVRRGFMLRCPNCDEGRVLHSYLKVNDECSVCGQSFRMARADDGPAYFTILIVAHIAGFALHIMWAQWEPSPLFMATSISAGALVLSFVLLPRFKGALIGFQWAKRLHGM